MAVDKFQIAVNAFREAHRLPCKQMEIEPNPCWEGYEPIGLKDDGSPNCVPIKEEQAKAKIKLPKK
jgi:hypothetical protein